MFMLAPSRRGRSFRRLPKSMLAPPLHGGKFRLPAVVSTSSGMIHNVGTATVALPTGAGIGQYLAIVTGTVSTVPSGWTQIYSDAATLYHGAYSARPSDSPGTGWVTTDSDGLSVCIAAYDRACTFDQHLSTGATSPTATATGIAVAARLYWNEGPTSATLGYPTAATLGRVQNIQQSSNSFAQMTGMAHQVVSAAGSVATAAWTPSSGVNATDPVATFLVYPST